MKKILAILIIITSSGFLLNACSSGNEQEAEKGKIERMTEETGSKISKSIQAPIDQAQKASELATQQAEEMEKRLQQEQ